MVLVCMQTDEKSKVFKDFLIDFSIILSEATRYIKKKV